MCGIIAITGKEKAQPILLQGLGQLEYRGYDSAGLALQRKNRLDVVKRAGRVASLAEALPKRSAATTGIAHTRWATHGEPNDLNAHPHTDASGALALVHNGIIENSDDIAAYLEARGVQLTSDTDTEVLAALIAHELERVSDLMSAVRSALLRVVGTYGIAVIHRDAPDEIVIGRNGSPVIIGIGDGAMLAASDQSALAPHTNRVVYLEDGEVARLTPKAFEIQDLQANPTERAAAEIDVDLTLASTGEHAHFTLKEIHEQPEAIERMLSGRLDERFATAQFGGLNLNARELRSYQRIKLLGCGSAAIAGGIGASMIEQIARIPTDAESAAEFRYKNPIIDPHTLYFAISQSGETFDTLSAVQEIQRKGGTVLGVVNVVGSSIARQCGAGLYLHAGPEVAVVSTKTFTNTLVAFALLALALGRMRDLSPADGGRIVTAISQLPEVLRSLIAREEEFAELARRYAHFDRAYFIGRGDGFGLAREGALKLKEISYIHAEAYPASELKHGPLALVDPQTPTFAIVPDDDLLTKNHATLAEIQTREGPTIAICQDGKTAQIADHAVQVPKLHPLIDPILMLIPLQFLAYHAALARGCDVDKPRNLAKSVTVE